MNKEEIVNGSKLLAEYLGWKYIPFNNLEEFSKPGWYKIKYPEGEKEVTITRSKWENGEEVPVGEPEKIVMDTTHFKYNIKSGWERLDDKFVKFVCRAHTNLRFYNSFDALIAVIEKLESEDLSEYFYEWEDKRGEHSNFMSVSFERTTDFSTIDVNLQLDQSVVIGSGSNENIIKDTFKACVEAVKYMNKLKYERI